MATTDYLRGYEDGYNDAIATLKIAREKRNEVFAKIRQNKEVDPNVDKDQELVCK